MSFLENETKQDFKFLEDVQTYQLDEVWNNLKLHEDQQEVMLIGVVLQPNYFILRGKRKDGKIIEAKFLIEDNSITKSAASHFYNLLSTFASYCSVTECKKLNKFPITNTEKVN